MNKYPVVITLSGKAHSGKDCVAKMIVDWCKDIGKKPFCLAYADQLKSLVSRNFDYSYDNKEDGRHYLQEFGDFVREREVDYFVHHVWHTIDLLRNDFDVFVITDARYENELSLYPYSLMYQTMNVYIDRNVDGELGEQEQSHSSEQMANNPDLDKFHFIIDNNGELESTKSQVDEIIDIIITNLENPVDLTQVGEVDE